MDFMKGTIIGIIAGTCIGYVGNETICEIMKTGKKELKKMKRKINF